MPLFVDAEAYFRRQAMFTHRREILAANPEVKLARDFGPLMGEHEREYWIWSLEMAEAAVNAARRPYVEIKDPHDGSQREVGIA